jgi:hypothetical protein
MNHLKIAAKVAYGPQDLTPEDANLQQAVWSAAQPHLQRVYKVGWYVPGEGFEGFLIVGSENAQAELEALKAKGGFSISVEEAIPLDEFKRIIESLP